MPALDPFVFLPVLAYGPAPGLELIPYFLALLGVLGSAVFAILLAPFLALFRRLRRLWATSPTESKGPPLPAPESPHERSHDRV